MTKLIAKNLKFFKEKGRRLWKPFVILFLVSFMIINWNDISWMFNYKVISARFSNFFKKESREEFIPAKETTKEFQYSEKEDSIEIPQIGVEAPIIFTQKDSDEDFAKALKNGVLLYPQSDLPGEAGITIILGHSAPPNWPKLNYDGIFNNLNELKEGDEVYIYFKNLQYSYRVTKKFFLEAGQKLPSSSLTDSQSVLILLSCWPPGKDQKRITVQAELVNNF